MNCLILLLVLLTGDYIINAKVISDSKLKEEECLTPNASKGVCIRLEECPTINYLANNYNGNITIETITFLISSNCGFDGNNPKVCCPREELSKATSSNST